MWDEFTIFDVMYLTGLPTDKMRSASGGYYECPECRKKGKFKINPSINSGVIRCAACTVGGDKLDLYVLCSGMHYTLVTETSRSGNPYLRPSREDRSEAAREIAEKMRIERKRPGFVEKTTKMQKRMEEAAQRASNSTRTPQEKHEVYSALLEILPLTDRHKRDLLARGLTEDDISTIGFKSAPLFGQATLTKKLTDKGLSLDGIAGFFKHGEYVDKTTGELIEEWNLLSTNAGYLIPLRDENGYIVSLQIRLNDTKVGKCMFFTSDVATLDCGTKADSVVHVEMCSEPPKYLYVTEGAIKAYVGHALYKDLFERDDAVFLAVPGTSNMAGIPHLMDHFLSKYNLERIVEFYDFGKFYRADAAELDMRDSEGEGFEAPNKNVARDRDNLERMLRDSMRKWRAKQADKYKSGEISPPTFTSFPKNRYKGKGLDDHLLAIKKERKNNSN
ncbi:MAG: hypothetical protein FWE32_02075 [Oscillospiraceae bacterium]|nr:hypothetical protein [Oscillospiraceae bacterium]